MKNFKLLFIACLAASHIQADIRKEVTIDPWEWNGKESVAQPGYFMMKNGEKLTGTIRMTGNMSYVNKLYIRVNGKESEVLPNSIKTYGFETPVGVNQTLPDVYNWKNGAQTIINGRTYLKSSTDKMKGYVNTKSGKRIEGILYLNAENEIVNEIAIKNEEYGKQYFKPYEVSSFGLNPLIADIREKEPFKEEGRNFYRGSIQKMDGTTVEGMIAFYRGYENNNGNIYSIPMIAIDDKTPVTFLSDNEVYKVTQVIGNNQVTYLSFSGNFIDEKDYKNHESIFLGKVFQPGKITLLNGKEITGEVELVSNRQSYFASRVMVKEGNGTLSLFYPQQVYMLEWQSASGMIRFASLKEYFAKLLYVGKSIWLSDNPYPVSANRAAESVVRESSYFTFYSPFASLIKDVGVAMVMKERMYYASKIPEYTIINHATNEEAIITENTYAQDIEVVLESCSSYLLMDEAQKKTYATTDSMIKAMELLDGCYSK